MMAPLVFMITLLLVFVNVSFAHYGHYTVEVRFVFDKKAMDNLASILKGGVPEARKQMEFDANMLINEVNKYYKSLKKFKVSIDIRPKKIDLMTDDIFTDSDNFHEKTYLKMYQVLPTLKKWLKKDKAQYDLIVFMTGYKLWTTYPVLGTSLGKVCEDHISLTAVSYNGTQMSAILIAHEIGHSLDMPHDSSGMCELAPNIGGYIMDSGGKQRQRYEFSECSSQNAEWKLTTLDFGGAVPQCLKKTSTKPHTFNYKQLRTSRMAHLYHREFLCKRALQTQNAYFCRKPNGKLRDRGNELCQEIYCRTSKGKCLPFLPTEGMPCSGKAFDFSRICRKGKCIPDV